MERSFLRTAEQKCPRAFAAKKVSGWGEFGLLSCKEADGVRKLIMFDNTTSRSRCLNQWEASPDSGCGVTPCHSDHVLETFAPEPIAV